MRDRKNIDRQPRDSKRTPNAKRQTIERRQARAVKYASRRPR